MENSINSGQNPENNSNNRELLATNRIEGLSDGVFGIAMTLLIFKIDVPDISTSLNFKSSLLESLKGMSPQFENYFISFILLGFYWTRHQLQFKHIKNADRFLLWINIFFLALIGLIPFTTGMVMKYTGHEVPQFLYCMNLVVIALVLAFHWYYACRAELIDHTLTKRYIKNITFVVFAMPVCFGVCAIAALISARLSLSLLYSIPVVFFFVKRYQRRRERKID